MILLKIYLLCWFFTEFEPIQQGINWIFTKLPSNIVLDSIWIALGCFKCVCLWSTLIITQSIWFALILSLIAQLHKRLIGE